MLAGLLIESVGVAIFCIIIDQYELFNASLYVKVNSCEEKEEIKVGKDNEETNEVFMTSKSLNMN